MILVPTNLILVNTFLYFIIRNKNVCLNTNGEGKKIGAFNFIADSFSFGYYDSYFNDI